ncbi:hypothetical protein [Streptomyces sp. YIM 98790]|uniref:hypothetical protein n=1 Tax=Streptomyces sp. YIM 98790 TaxID=2689077 RepID=UPI001FB7C293|nr:hypothetical protein [Streptomyces sp. YIM 98790]
MTQPPQDPRTGALWRGPEPEQNTDEATVRLPGGSGRGGEDGYSATELDGSWDGAADGVGGTGGGTAPLPLALPGEPADQQPTALAPGRTPDPDGTARTLRDPDVPGGHGEEVLRFGPGPPGAAEDPSHGTAAGIWRGETPPGGTRPAGRLRWLRRYGLAVVVLIAVAAFLLWDRTGPGLEITAVSARTDATSACDSTADVVGVVRTNGRPGTLTYQWSRSDGTSSGVLKERVTRGQTEVLLHLLWTFQGEGTVTATAQLRITEPSTHTASVSFTYTCP